MERIFVAVVICSIVLTSVLLLGTPSVWAQVYKCNVQGVAAKNGVFVKPTKRWMTLFGSPIVVDIATSRVRFGDMPSWTFWDIVQKGDHANDWVLKRSKLLLGEAAHRDDGVIRLRTWSDHTAWIIHYDFGRLYTGKCVAR